jgi:WD40 repeat protein
MHHVGPIAGVAAHGSWIASAGYDNRLILWDATSRRALARSAHDHLVNACAFSHDGRYLVSASSDYSARIWSPARPAADRRAGRPWRRCGHGPLLAR